MTHAPLTRTVVAVTGEDDRYLALRTRAASPRPVRP